MTRQEAVELMKAHIDIKRSHSLLWGMTGDTMQEGKVEELAEWFVDQAFHAGLLVDEKTNGRVWLLWPPDTEPQPAPFWKGNL